MGRSSEFCVFTKSPARLKQGAYAIVGIRVLQGVSDGDPKAGKNLRQLSRSHTARACCRASSAGRGVCVRGDQQFHFGCTTTGIFDRLAKMRHRQFSGTHS